MHREWTAQSARRDRHSFRSHQCGRDSPLRHRTRTDRADHASAHQQHRLHLPGFPVPGTSGPRDQPSRWRAPPFPPCDGELQPAWQLVCQGECPAGNINPTQSSDFAASIRSMLPSASSARQLTCSTRPLHPQHTLWIRPALIRRSSYRATAAPSMPVSR